MKFSVVVHSKVDCPHCDDAKAYLGQLGIPYDDVRLDDDDDRQAFYDAMGLEGRDRTVPQVVLVDPLDGEMWRIGGAKELRMSGIGDLFR